MNWLVDQLNGLVYCLTQISKFKEGCAKSFLSRMHWDQLLGQSLNLAQHKHQPLDEDRKH